MDTEWEYYEQEINGVMEHWLQNDVSNPNVTHEYEAINFDEEDKYHE